MRAHELTLNDIKADLKPKNRVVRVSDFLTNDEKIRIKLHRQLKSAKKRRGFDEVDAYSAEILARFGYYTWRAWKNGEIPTKQMNKYILAERARSKRALIGLECIIVQSVAGANHPDKHGHTPKTLKGAQKALEKEGKAAQGVGNG